MAGSRDKKELSPNQIREIKAALDYLSGRIEEIAGEMESRKIPTILVGKFKTFKRVKGLIIGTTGAFQEGLDTAVTATPAWDLERSDDPAALADQTAKLEPGQPAKKGKAKK